MPTRFGINGLGRIGRCLFRAAAERPGLQLSAANDIAAAGPLAGLLRRDSVHGRFARPLEASGEDVLLLDGRPVALTHFADPAEIPWPEDTEVVVDATGKATRRARAARHLRAPAPHSVVISAVSPDADFTLCPGINQDDYDPRRHQVIASASCTTHCLALLLKVLHESFGVERALMNEVHSYTANQSLVDGVNPDPRRGRAAAINIVPTYSAAPGACEALFPELRGRLRGQATRVPTPDVALLDLTAELSRPADEAAIAAVFREAAAGRLQGLLAVSDEPLVSSDFIGDSHSAIVDATLIQSVGGRLVKVMAWYDNEWGYAHRLADLLSFLGAER
jgi:glyceraldehyde 3-phosphate dehydrogenase